MNDLNVVARVCRCAFFHFYEGHNVDLANLYEFVAALKKLSITDYISQMSNGEQYDVAFAFDLGMFTSLSELQVRLVCFIRINVA